MALLVVAARGRRARGGGSTTIPAPEATPGHRASPGAAILYSPSVLERNARASRRAVLACGAGALVAGTAACGSADGPGVPGPADEPASDADSDLVERVTDDLAEAAALAAATGRAFPSLRPLTGPLASLHRAHGTELGGLPDPATRSRPDGPASRARAALLAAEERLQRRLVQASVAAESGALAQTLASMAAAVAQRRVVA